MILAPPRVQDQRTLRFLRLYNARCFVLSNESSLLHENDLRSRCLHELTKDIETLAQQLFIEMAVLAALESASMVSNLDKHDPSRTVDDIVHSEHTPRSRHWILYRRTSEFVKQNSKL